MRASAISRCHLVELLTQVLLVDERPPGQEIPFEVLHAGFDFPLGLGAIGAAEMRLETPVVGELLEGRIPDDPAVAAGLTDGPGPIVEVLAGVAAEVVEGAFVRVEELAERLPQARLMEAPARVAERQDEHVQNHGAMPDVDLRLAPVDLALLPRRRLEPHRRPLRRLLRGTQWTHEALHRLIAPAIPARPAQLLKENARRVLHLGGAGAQEARVLGEQRVRALGARVRLPRALAENAAHCLAIELQLPGDLGLRPPLRVEQPMHLAPAVLPNHASLPERCDLGARVGGGRRRARQQCLRHDDALLREEGGEFSMTTRGDYWVTADSGAWNVHRASGWDAATLGRQAGSVNRLSDPVLLQRENVLP